MEEFEPINPPEVRIYVCGLTPSAPAHVGHARTYLFFDVLRRYLAHRGYAVNYVQNVTDVDDRSIAQAAIEGGLWSDVINANYASFKASMRRLGVAEPDEEPYATAFIEPINESIAQLIDRGYAYVTKDGVYYRVARFARYGALSGRNLDDLEAGARVQIDEHKEDPLDFALWKFAKPDEPRWESPWGLGRPGWHIECSAMSRVLLDLPGRGFDIHGGGADLIFPHHENEIAQSEPVMERPPMANFWLHGGILQFENRKMSKSLGNFEPLSDLLARHDPQAVRLLFLQTGYRKVMNFTEESIGAATVALERIKAIWRQLPAAGAAPFSGALLRGVEAMLDDDVNTSGALAEIFNLRSGEATSTRDELEIVLALLGIPPNETWREIAAPVLPAKLGACLKESLGSEVRLDPSTPAQQALEEVLAMRAAARARKDWGASDRLRDALLRCGIAVKDEKSGETTWDLL